ncbi:hypothetical protein EII18_08470 [Comamonadaceae bacterium OH3737_COT-264]|nr:hypothetical protein EII18_08470 [Comamonadaceae bacterium OH3737_COT-264]
MAMQLSPTLEAVRDILKNAGLKGMHVDDIAAAAVAANKNMGLPAQEFSRRIQAALAANLKLKTQRPTFARVAGKKKGQFKRGWYRLKVERTGSVLETIAPPETDRAYLGRAGEMAVISELLFWGYNASAMLVDSGIDVVASKAGKYFHLQVKTASEIGGRFQFTIKQGAFQQNHNSSTFYVFVLRKALASEFVIIPSSYVQALIAGGKIANGPTLSVAITVDDKRHKYLLNGSVDVGIYVGNFGGIIV